MKISGIKTPDSRGISLNFVLWDLKNDKSIRVYTSALNRQRGQTIVLTNHRSNTTKLCSGHRHVFESSVKVRKRRRTEAGGKLASTQIITCVHTYAVAERNPLRNKWVRHPIFHVHFETARSKPSLSSRNGRSARVRSAYVWTYRQTSNISRTSVANKIGDHSDVVGASSVGAVPTTSSFST